MRREEGKVKLVKGDDKVMMVMKTSIGLTIAKEGMQSRLLETKNLFKIHDCVYMDFQYFVLIQSKFRSHRVLLHYMYFLEEVHMFFG